LEPRDLDQVPQELLGETLDSTMAVLLPCCYLNC
jgi:hypothetical protein